MKIMILKKSNTLYNIVNRYTSLYLKETMFEQDDKYDSTLF